MIEIQAQSNTIIRFLNKMQPAFYLQIILTLLLFNCQKVSVWRNEWFPRAYRPCRLELRHSRLWLISTRSEPTWSSFTTHKRDEAKKHRWHYVELDISNRIQHDHFAESHWRKHSSLTVATCQAKTTFVLRIK